MAYGKKYNISWSDLRLKGLTAEIHQKDFVGAVTAVITTGDVGDIDWKKSGNYLDPTKPSTANLQLYSETDFQWQEFFVTEVNEYFVKFIFDGDTVWQGIYIDTVYNEPYVDAPYFINLRFSCGLSELKNIDYLDGSGNFLTGFESLLTILQRCLNKLPYNLRLKEIINVFDDDMLPTHYSLNFGGTNQYLTVADADNLSFGDSSTDSPFSISGWIKLVDATQSTIASKRGANPNAEYLFAFNSTDKLQFHLYDENSSNRIGIISNMTFTADQDTWIYVALTYDGSGTSDGMKLYRNGILLAHSLDNLSSYTAMHNTTQAFEIGTVLTGIWNMDGKMDEMKLIGKELSATEMLEDYNGGIIPKRESLSFFASIISPWAMGEGGTFGGGNWTIPDEIGSNDATSVNMEEADRVTDTPVDRNSLNSTLASTYIDNSIFVDLDNAGNMKARSCRYVIDEIMKSIGCRIFQSSSDPEVGASPENVWWVQRIEELSDETESKLDFWEYNSNGTLYDSGRLTSLIKTITNTEAGITFLHSDAELEIILAIKTIKYKRTLVFKWVTKNNLIFDEHFCHWIKNVEDFTGGGGSVETFESYKPRYWFLSPALQALTNFNDFGTASFGDNYIIRVLSLQNPSNFLKLIRFGRALMAAYDDYSTSFYIEAQFYQVEFAPYGAPTPRSTKERIQINTADSLVLSYDMTFYQRFTIDGEEQTDILMAQALYVALVFQIILTDIATGNKYFLIGHININDIQVGVFWTIRTTEETVNTQFVVYRICTTERATDFVGKINLPNFPFTGNAKLTFRVYVPRKYDIEKDVGDIFVKWIDMVDLEECDLQYVTAKKVINTGVCSPSETVQTAKSLEEIVNLQDSDIIRDNDHSLVTIMGDGPDESAMGSFRYKVNANNFPITDKWSRLNASPAQDKSARDIFLIDVLKNFLSTQKTKLTGTLYGLTDFNFQNVIISDKAVRYIMDGMTWNLKTGEKKPTLLELTTEVGSWVQNVAPNEVVVDVSRVPSAPGGNVFAGTTFDSDTVVIGGSAGTGTSASDSEGSVSDIGNYPL
ncbi:MAG TPA: LamG domain-containing protein [bacterium]|nr:LamG domain-containing protein [bacterium]